MSDRSPLTLTVYDCPSDQAAAVLQVITEHGLCLEWEEEAPLDALHTRTQYTHTDAPLGTEADLAAALIDAAPGCAFRTWQDPKYEADGQVVMYHPDLGRCDCACNAFGDPHVTIEQIRCIAAECGVEGGRMTSREFVDALCRRLGDPWHIALLAAEERTITPTCDPPAPSVPPTTTPTWRGAS